MKVARIISPVFSLGPGRRVAVWTAGCSKKCKGCISPELQSANGYREVPVPEIAESILMAARENNCNALTISGGDPLEQAAELAELLRIIRPGFRDILVFTGYTLDHLKGMQKESPSVLDVLGQIDVLVDGKYEEQLNDGTCAMRGSTNQIIHYLNPQIETLYDSYLKQGRLTEIFSVGKSIVEVGIPRNGQ